jgi:antitoxin HicB
MPTNSPYPESAYSARVAPEPTTDGTLVYGSWYEELPGCESQGDTPEEARENLREAFALYVGSLVEDGMPVPPPRANAVREIIWFANIGAQAQTSAPSNLWLPFLRYDRATYKGNIAQTASGMR